MGVGKVLYEKKKELEDFLKDFKPDENKDFFSKRKQEIAAYVLEQRFIYERDLKDLVREGKFISKKGKPMSRRMTEICVKEFTDKYPQFRYGEMCPEKVAKRNQSQREKAVRAKQQELLSRKAIDDYISKPKICFYCGQSGKPLEVHHCVPVSWGGTNDRINLVWLCHECHGKITHYHEMLNGKYNYVEYIREQEGDEQNENINNAADTTAENY